MASKIAGNKCRGFGEYEHKCTNETNRNPYWCDRCDELRLDHISKRFDEIENRMKGRHG